MARSHGGPRTDRLTRRLTHGSYRHAASYGSTAFSAVRISAVSKDSHLPRFRRGRKGRRVCVSTQTHIHPRSGRVVDDVCWFLLVLDDAVLGSCLGIDTRRLPLASGAQRHRRSVLSSARPRTVAFLAVALGDACSAIREPVWIDDAVEGSLSVTRYRRLEGGSSRRADIDPFLRKTQRRSRRREVSAGKTCGVVFGVHRILPRLSVHEFALL